MFKQVIKNIKSYKSIMIILITVFSICQLSITLFTVGYKNTAEGLKKQNNGLKETAIMFAYSSGLKDKTYINQVIEEINQDIEVRLISNIVISKIDFKPRIYIDIYKNNQEIIPLPIIKGKNFERKNINEGDAVLLGKDIYKDLGSPELNSKIKILGKEYKIIGIIGSNKFKTELDYTTIIASSKLDKNLADNVLNNSMNIDMILNGNGNEFKVAEELSKKIKEKEEYPAIDIKEIESNRDILLNAFGDNTYFVTLIIMSYILGIFSCIYIVNYWIKIMEPKLIVRIAFGSSRMETIIFVLMNIFILAIMSTVLSILVLLVVNSYLSSVLKVNFNLYIENLVIAFALCVSNSLIIVTVNLFNILKINPSANVNKL